MLDTGINEVRGDRMKLYLIQHGEAKSEPEDPERSLTVHGEEEVTFRPGKAGGLIKP